MSSIAVNTFLHKRNLNAYDGVEYGQNVQINKLSAGYSARVEKIHNKKLIIVHLLMTFILGQKSGVQPSKYCYG